MVRFGCGWRCSVENFSALCAVWCCRAYLLVQVLVGGRGDSQVPDGFSLSDSALGENICGRYLSCEQKLQPRCEQPTLNSVSYCTLTSD